MADLEDLLVQLRRIADSLEDLANHRVTATFVVPIKPDWEFSALARDMQNIGDVLGAAHYSTIDEEVSGTS